MSPSSVWLPPGAISVALCLLGCGGSLPPSPSGPSSPEGRPGSSPQATSPTPPLPSDEIGRQVVRALAAGEHEAIRSRFDDTMSEALSAEQLAELWEAVQAQVGPYQGIASVEVRRREGYEIVVVTTRFGAGLLDLRVVLDGSRRITGLFVEPSTKAQSDEPPPYADLAAIEEQPVRFGEDPWILPGTLSRPRDAESPCPGLVLVHGSGPNDRDESVGANKPFRDLALGLATRGVCVLRYDKRTKVHGERVLATFGDDLTLHEETVEDAQRAATFLARQPGVDPKRVFVLGHSLGGMALPRIAADAPTLRGLVILAGSTRPLEDAVLDQVRYVTEIDGTTSAREREMVAEVQAQVARVKRLTREAEPPADGTPPPASALPLGIPPAYWRDLAAHPPGPAIAKESRPVLVLHGDRDYQVTEIDLVGWQRALESKPNATIIRYPDLDHLFIEGRGKSTPADYLKPGHVAPRVIEDVARWIAQH